MAVRKMTASEVRADFGENVNRVAYTNDTIVIEKRKRPMAVLISWEHFGVFEALLNRFEDEFDTEILMKRRGEETVSLEEMLKRLE